MKKWLEILITPEWHTHTYQVCATNLLICFVSLADHQLSVQGLLLLFFFVQRHVCDLFAHYPPLVHWV